MLGACTGGEGSPQADHTCDTRKGEKAILLNPLDPAHVATLYCTSSGHLKSTDPRYQADIDDRLGLNHRVLVAARRAKFDQDWRRLVLRHRTSSIPEGHVRRLVAELEAPDDRKLPELCCVLRLWARKRFGGTW